LPTNRSLRSRLSKSDRMIPILDLKQQYLDLKPEIDAAIQSVLESGQFVLGREVAAFEEEFAAFCGAPYSIGLNSGTSALHLALLAAGVGPGDEVITVPFSFIATVATIGYVGARPVFVDIEPQTFNLDPARLEAAITPRTKAIMPVHLYGQPADMDPIVAIARKHNLVVIEDAAQAHGAEYRGRRAGSLADIACFSFYPGKNLGAFGEGGAVVTANPEFNRQIRLLRDWGAAKKYEHTIKGYNYRMEAMQGAILRVKLRHLERWTELRRAHAAQYGRLLSAPVAPPVEMSYARHVWCVYSVRTPRRDEVQARLLGNGVQTAIHYPIPIHLQPAWSELGYRRGDFPAAEQAAVEVLALPVYPELTEAQVATVAEALTAVHTPEVVR
jgi:dTDP-4-amino-4,6-dideoxygalactose transaminase